MIAKEILIPLVMVGVTVTLSAIINTKIKFAPTADHAIKDIKRILLYVAFFALQAYMLGSLIWAFVSDSPLTKGSLAVILMYSFGLFHTYLLYWIWRLGRMFEAAVAVMEKLNEQSRQHVGITRDVVDMIASRSSTKQKPKRVKTD